METDVLPFGLLAHPDVRSALTGRDFGRLFAVARRHGVSYYRPAAACGMKVERVSLVARGRAQVTSLAAIERIADGLRIPGALLGLAERSWEEQRPAPAGPSVEGEDPMQRRHLVLGAGAVALGITPAHSALAATRLDVDRALTPGADADLDSWEATAEDHARGYRGRPPHHVLAALAHDVSGLRPLLDSPLRVTDRVRLCRVTAQLTGMPAIVLHDLGEHREAGSWFRTSATAAAQSTDRTLHAWVLGRAAMLPLNFGAPGRAADLAERARRAAGRRPTAAAALAASVAARSHALSGDTDRAHRALAEADRIADRLPAAERADTWLGHPEQKHQVHASHALTVLGETRRARESRHHALELSAPSSTMTRGLLALDDAACWVHDGDPAQACHAAVTALTGLPDGWRTGLTRTRAVDLLYAIPAARRNEPAARELAAVLAP